MIPEISPGEYVRRRDAGENLLLLDVREPYEVEIASVPGALHVPMAQVPERLAEIDRNREVVVLCRSGGRSLRVAMFLQQQGYPRVANLSGGILRWGEELDPSLPAY
jgi:adenylyltransferase/sulfurtransferase